MGEVLAARQEAVLFLGPVAVNLDRWQASMNGQVIDMTPGEMGLIAALTVRKGKLVSAADVRALAQQRGRKLATSPASLRVFICRLRKTLRATGAPEMIGHVRGHGYIARDPAPAEGLAHG